MKNTSILPPTHENCRQVVRDADRWGVPYTAYPEITSDNCRQVKLVKEAQRQKLNFRHAVCDTCPFRNGCAFWEEVEAAKLAHNRVATQDRGIIRMPEITNGTEVLVVEEAATRLLAPHLEARSGFSNVADLAKLAMMHRYCTPETLPFYQSMYRVAREFHGLVHSVRGNEQIALPLESRMPEVAHRLLLEISRYEGSGSRKCWEAMALVVAVVRGDIHELYALVREEPRPANDTKVKRALVGISRTQLPSDIVMLFNEAGGKKATYEALTGEPVIEITPATRLPYLFPVRQILVDVTKETSAVKAGDILAGILWDYKPKKPGLITHQCLVKPLAKRFPEVKVSHFHSGEARGSNDWIGHDLLVVLGTPRVPCRAVQIQLLKERKVAAGVMTAEDAEWKEVWWPGKTEDGDDRPVSGPSVKGYADPWWAEAHHDLVVGEIRQALGRARSHLPEGMPAVAVTTENLSEICPIAFHEPKPLSKSHRKVLQAFYADGGSYRRTTPQLIAATGLTKSWLLDVLHDLEEAGRVGRVGGPTGRRGWWAKRPELSPVVPYVSTKEPPDLAESPAPVVRTS
jgi:hypothetical protein